VHGGAGGVGLAAIALARQAGCDVYATAGGPDKVAYLEREAGVTRAVDHTVGSWLEAFGQASMDVVLDPVGGAHLQQSLRCIKPGGRVVAYGASDAAGPRRNLLRGARMLRAMRMSAIPLVMHSKALMGLNLLRLWDAGMDLRPQAENILTSMVAGSLPKPHVDRVFPIEEAAAAHQYIHDRRNVGKVLLGF
jgi:NADPH:quinone reductase-like Zn-dependent oxidoreductase